jgi:hypothetical protein
MIDPLSVVSQFIRKRKMNRLIAITSLLFISGCASMHSPYDMYEWCVNLGSSRLTSIGSTAQNPATCQRELQEDLEDQTPRFLYIPRDVVMAPVTAARLAWNVLGLTRAPF